MGSLAGTDAMTIGALVDRAADRHGDREAYVVGGERVTFARLREDVDRVARGLIAHGVGPGDRVALWMPNALAWVHTYLAAVRIGAVLVPVNVSFTRAEVAGLLERAPATLVVAEGRHRDRDLTEEARRASDAPVVPASALAARADEVDPATLAARRAAVRPDEPCLLLFSSGTTGRPKGVLHGHRVVDTVVRAVARQGLGPDDVLVHYLPLFHIYGAASVLSLLYAGGRTVLMPRFDAGEALALMERERATLAYGIGAMYHDLLGHPSLPERDLTSVRLCMVSGPGALVEQVSARIGPAVNVWGMTEDSGISTLAALDDPPELRAHTNGRPLDDVEVRVVRADGTPAPPDERGELQVRGAGLMLGYHGDPEGTAAAFQDGWLRTGDVAQLRADGYLVFLGRSTDVLRVGGEQVDPVEVESVLMRHPAVLSAAVIAVPHARLAEVPHAFVRLRDGAEVTEAELVAHASAVLAGFKVPRTVDVVDAFPTTESGKIRKNLLRPLDRGGPA